MTAVKIRVITVLVLLAVVAIIGFSGIYVVNEGEQAVVLTFGKLTDTKDPGMYWHMPMAQTVRKQSTEAIYTLEYGFRTNNTATTKDTAQYNDENAEAIMLTGDQSIIKVEAIYQVVVRDVAQFFYKVDDPFDTMQKAFESVLRRNMQNHTLDDALLNKDTIEEQVLQDFRNVLKPYELGVQINSVKFQNIEVPDEVVAAYQDVNNAKNEKTRRLDEAAKYKNQIVPNARAQAYKMLQDAEAYRAKTVANAEGEVSEFNKVLEKYRNSKSITRTRLLIETLESMLASADHVYIMDEDSGVLKMLTLTPGETKAPQATAAPVEGGN